MELNSQTVRDLFLSCFYKESELEKDEKGDHIQPDNAVMVKAITVEIGFEPNRLKENESKIIDLLEKLPSKIKLESGISFIDLCYGSDGILWTGFHKSVEELVIMGIAIGVIEFANEREFWHLNDCGVPNIIYKPKKVD